MTQGHIFGHNEYSIVKVMREEDGFFAKLVCAMSGKELKLAGFAFMDNMDLCATQERTKKRSPENAMSSGSLGRDTVSIRWHLL